MSPKIIAVAVFTIVYVFLAASSKYRARSLWLGVGVMSLLGVYVDAPGRIDWNLIKGVPQVLGLINWNVMGIFAGVLLVAEFFVITKVPVLLADILVDKSRTAGQAMLMVCALAGVVSIFVENVAAVLIVAPLALQIARRLDISPAPFLIGIAISSNLQGTSTLVGDPPSMILAAGMGMNFNDFFVYHGKLGIFFAVQLGAISSLAVLWLFYRKHKQPAMRVPKEKVTSWVPTILLAAMLAALAVDPWLGNLGLHLPSGLVCMIFGAGAVIWSLFNDPRQTWHVVRNYDYRTVAFLAGVFAVVGALSLPQVGLVDDITALLGGLVGDSRAVALIVIVGFSLAFSAFVDNVPYVTAMLPVAKSLSAAFGNPDDPLLAFGLLIGACLGGNITPIGASANVVTVGLLRREGFSVSFKQFIKMGLPFTLAATIPATLVLWFIWR